MYDLVVICVVDGLGCFIGEVVGGDYCEVLCDFFYYGCVCIDSMSGVGGCVCGIVIERCKCELFWIFFYYDE